MKTPLTILVLILFSCSDGKVVFKESFDYPDGPLPSEWWSEGCPAVIKDGHLFVDAETDSCHVSTIWLDKNLSGDLQLEFDAHIVSSSDSSYNINCFFLYSDPSGTSLRNTAEERRSGDYSLYHEDLEGYIFTFVAGGNTSKARYRFRDNPGFHLIKENYHGETRAGKTYHIKIIKIGNRIQYWNNDEKIFDMVEDKFNPPHHSGLFGFRTFHTKLWWDNLVISRVE